MMVVIKHARLHFARCIGRTRGSVRAWLVALGMAITVLIPTMSRAVASSSSERTYAELIERATIVAVTTRGDHYTRRLYRLARHIAEPVAKTCAVTPQSNAVVHTVTVVAPMHGDGVFGTARFTPDNLRTRCFVKQLHKLAWPALPGHDGPLVVGMRFDVVSGALLRVVGTMPHTTPARPPPPPGTSRVVYAPPALPPGTLAGHCRGTIQVSLDADGAVRKAKVGDHCNQPGADAAALDAMRQWVFMPSWPRTKNPASESGHLSVSFGF